MKYSGNAHALAADSRGARVARELLLMGIVCGAGRALFLTQLIVTLLLGVTP